MIIKALILSAFLYALNKALKLFKYAIDKAFKRSC